MGTDEDGLSSDGYTFNLESSMFEVEKEGCFEAGDVKVSKHLGEVGIIEGSDNLGIDDNSIVDDKVGDECANELCVVVDGVLFLLITNQALVGELDNEGTFIEFFIETGLESVEHLYRRSDDDFGELFVVGEHEKFLPRISRMGTDEDGLSSDSLKISVSIRAIRGSEIFTTDFTDEHG